MNGKQLETREIDILIQKGIEFEVVEQRRVRGSWKTFFRPRWVEITHKYHIKEPPLGVLDLLSSEYIQLEHSEQELKQNPLATSKRLVREHAMRVSRIIAIAILGSKSRDKRTVRRLANLMYRSVTPSKLAQLTEIINIMGNYWSFTSSIRSMSSARTTKPSLVE